MGSRRYIAHQQAQPRLLCQYPSIPQVHTFELFEAFATCDNFTALMEPADKGWQQL